MDYEEEKKDPASADTVSVSSRGPETPEIDSDNELDPVMLNKAFRFAAWSSIVLVSTHCFELHGLTNLLVPPACRPTSYHPSTAVLRPHSVRQARIRGMGCYRHDMGIRISVHRHHLSPLGE